MPDPVFTDAGKTLMLKALSGDVQLVFTRIVIGDGELSAQTPESLTGVIHEVASIPITRVKRRLNYISLGGPFDLSDLTSGFWWRELSLYAMDPDEGEIAFNYANAGDQGEYLESDGKKLQRMLTINAFVSNLENIIVNINESLAFATVSDMDEMRQEFTTALGTKLTAADILAGANINIQRENGKATISAAAPGSGPVGPAGVDAISIDISHSALVIPAGISAPSGSGSQAITIKALKGGTPVNVSVGTIAGLTTGLTATITNNNTQAVTVTVAWTTALTAANGAITIPLSIDGKSFTRTVSWSLSRTGATGSTGSTGAAGTDACTVELSSEAFVFPAGISAAVAGSFACNVIAFKGATQMAATIGAITGQVTGLTAAIASNGTVNANITLNVTTALTTRSGVLTVPVTVDGKTFTKRISWALALTGEQGKDALAFYGTCPAAAATVAKTVAAAGFALATGARIVVKWTNTNTAANPTLNVNGTGAVAMYCRGTRITNTMPYLLASGVNEFVYTGSYYELVADDSKGMDRLMRMVTASDAATVSLSFAGINLSLYEEIRIHLRNNIGSGYKFRVNGDSGSGRYVYGEFGYGLEPNNGAIVGGGLYGGINIQVRRGGDTSSGAITYAYDSVSCGRGYYQYAQFIGISTLEFLPTSTSETVPAGTVITVWGVR